MQERWVQFLGQEDPLEKEMATHSSILGLGNPIDRGAWQATVQGVTKKSDTTLRLKPKPVKPSYPLILFMTPTVFLNLTMRTVA